MGAVLLDLSLRLVISGRGLEIILNGVIESLGILAQLQSSKLPFVGHPQCIYPLPFDGIDREVPRPIQGVTAWMQADLLF